MTAVLVYPSPAFIGGVYIPAALAASESQSNDDQADKNQTDDSQSGNSGATAQTLPEGLADSPSFRQAIAVDMVENDVSVHPAPSAFGAFDLPDMPDFDADAYILIDRRTGLTINAKNADAKLYPASITKIMTAILALEMGDMGQMMTASVRAIRDIGPDGSNIGIVVGEEMRLDNLLDALLVRSANEAANIIAESLCETREDFIDLMNAKAKELGAYNTHFTNASGIHDTAHYSTAYDLAVIANYAMENARFREIVIKRNIILAPTNKHSLWERLNTNNSLLTDSTIRSYDVTGIKTGYHSDAGYCMVASGRDNDGMELLCVVLGVRGTAAGTSGRRFRIASDLLTYGFDNFQLNTFIRDNELLGTISVLGGENIDTVDVKSDGTIRLFMPSETEEWKISRIEYIKSEIAAPVKYGDRVGFVEFRNSGVFAGRVNITAMSDVSLLRGGAREAPGRGDTGSARSALSLANATAKDGASSKVAGGFYTSSGGALVREDGESPFKSLNALLNIGRATLAGGGAMSGPGAGGADGADATGVSGRTRAGVTGGEAEASGAGTGAGSGASRTSYNGLDTSASGSDTDGSGSSIANGSSSGTVSSGSSGSSGAGGGSNSNASRFDGSFVIKVIILILLLLAALVSILRTVNTIRRNKRRALQNRYNGRLEQPPAGTARSRYMRSGRPQPRPQQRSSAQQRTHAQQRSNAQQRSQTRQRSQSQQPPRPQPPRGGRRGPGYAPRESRGGYYYTSNRLGNRLLFKN